MRSIVVLLVLAACAEPPVRARSPEWADRRTKHAPGSDAIERLIHEARDGSRLWFGTDVQVDAETVRFRPCDEDGACRADIETAPLEDFLGVTAVPDSTLQQLRFREGSPTDKHLAFLASRGR